jgi:hypothetical protein
MTDTESPDDVSGPGLGPEGTARPTEHPSKHPTEGTDQADGCPSPSAPGFFPLFEIVDEFVAQHPVLHEVTTPRKTTWRMVFDSKHLLDRDHKSRYRMMMSGTAGLLQHIDDLDPQDHAVLIIEDINAEFYHLLCTRYSTSLDAEFLAQHILRLADLKTSFGPDRDNTHELERAFSELVRDVSAKISRTHLAFSNGRHLRGRHIDGIIGIQGVPRSVRWWEFPGHCQITARRPSESRWSEI